MTGAEADLLADRLLELPLEDLPGLLARMDQDSAADPGLRLAVAIVEALGRIDRDRWQQTEMFRSLVRTLAIGRGDDSDRGWL